MDLTTITDHLVDEIRVLNFGPPVGYVYNPLEYAREAYDKYLRLYGSGQKEIVLLGMNPGPWGMAQTGIPFGEVSAVKEWLCLETAVGNPAEMHPKKPVHGFACKRSEVSGKRLWGWAKKRFERPGDFFARFLVINYCPLLFIEEHGRNLTPEDLPISERKPLLAACDYALFRTVEQIKPKYLIGVGQFAWKRARLALSGLDLTIGVITHPSPANPKANRDWDSLVTSELQALGVEI